MPRILAASILLLLLPGAFGTSHTASEAAAGVMLVRWRPTVRLAERAAVRQALGVRETRTYDAIGVEKLTLAGGGSEAALAQLASDPRVEFAEPDLMRFVASTRRVPGDPRFAEQWALRNTGQTGGAAGADVRADRGWDVATDASGVIVGVVDTGCDAAHPDLAANLWVNAGEIPGNGIDDDENGYIDDVHGYDFLNQDGDPADDHGHGTHVAGIIAATGDNGIGVTGIAWRGRVMALKFLGSSGSGPTSAAIEAILYAVRMGARIVNHSWGGGPYSQALEAAFAHSGRAGVLSVIAAGNHGVDLEVQPVYPPSFDDPAIVTVAATDASDGLASFSNRGLVSVDLGAPGAGILSLAPGGQYAVLSGTSMAAPLAAGAAALLLAREPALDAIALRQRLMASAWPLLSLQGRTVSGGRLDLVRLLAEPEDDPPSAIADLRFERVGSHSAWLAWTAPGDDGDVGRADRYLLRIATGEPGSLPFEAMTPVVPPEPSEAGTFERFRVGGLEPSTSYWLVLRAMDDRGNAGPLTAPAVFTTQPPPRASLDRTEVSGELPAGASERHTVTLSNPSEGTLEWAIAAPSLATGGGGPASAGGYSVEAHGSATPPRFEWVSRGGEAVTLAVEGDEAVSAPLPLPFEFPFFGRSERSLRVSSNGFVTFAAEDPAPQPVALPSSVAPRAMVAPFWADLDAGASERRIWMQSDPLRVVITWEGTRPFGAPDAPLSFQLWLLRTGEIRFQYLSLSGRGAIASAGLQAFEPGRGVRVAHRDGVLRDSLAVRLLPPRAWARAAPALGVLGPGESEQISVDLLSRGLADGLQQGAFEILTDSPSEPVVVLAARLAARAAPHVVVSHSWLDFGVTPSGLSRVRALGVANEGALPARIGAVSVMGAGFEAPQAGFDLQPGEVRSVPVGFTPARDGEQRAVLSVTSDDPKESRLDVVLAGEGRAPGQLVMSPSEIRGTAAIGVRPGSEQDVKWLALSNPGGMAVPWRLSTFAAAAPTPPREGLAPPAGPARGPDPVAYRWRSSDEPGAPPFEWIEIAHSGERLFGGADDSVATGVRLPFEFPFYGRSFSGISVCTNGWMAFESSAPLREGRPLPDPAAPLGLIAPFWTDLDARPVGGPSGVFAGFDGDRFIVEWKDLRRFGTAERFSFQVWMWSDGRIDFQYRVMAGTRTGATIGIQDADGAAGLTLAHGAALARDSLRIALRPAPEWLSASQYEGVLEPGGTETLAVRFHAEGLAAGRWEGALRFDVGSGEPGLTQVVCALRAGSRPVAASLRPERWRAASESPLLEIEYDDPAADAAEWWLAGRALSPLRVEPLAGGRSRITVESDRVLPWLAGGAQPRAFAVRNEDAGWGEAALPLAIDSLPFAVTGLPGESEAQAPEQRTGEERELAWPAFPGVTRVHAWLRTAPGVWERIAESAGSSIRLRWPGRLDSARLELVARSDSGVVGVWRSAEFAIAGEAPPGPPDRLALSVSGAHPSRSPVTLELALPAPTDVRADVFDVRGARMRELALGAFGAGRHPLVWDGRLRNGARAASGVYLIRVHTGLGELTRRLVLIARP